MIPFGWLLALVGAGAMALGFVDGSLSAMVPATIGGALFVGGCALVAGGEVARVLRETRRQDTPAETASSTNDPVVL